MRTPLQMCYCLRMTSQSQSLSVADILSQALQTKSKGCAVGTWLGQQDEQTTVLMQTLEENRRQINITRLYGDLNRAFDLPFGLTLFKSHLAGSCVCQNK